MVKLSILLTSFLILYFIVAPVATEAKDQAYEYGVRRILSGPLWAFFEENILAPKLISLPDVDSLIINQGSIITSNVQQFNDSLFINNIRVTEDYGEIPFENEPSIAANKIDPSNLIIATHDYGQVALGYPRVVAYSSLNGGNTWEGPVVMPLSQPTDLLAADPALASDRLGNFYLSYLSLGFVPEVGISSDIMLAKSSDGGSTWSVNVAVSRFSILEDIRKGTRVLQYLLDKEYVATGPLMGQEDKDLIVITFTEIVQTFNINTRLGFINITIKAVTSADGGLTFSSPVSVSPTFSIKFPSEAQQLPFKRVVQGSMPAIGPDGTVYVAYYDSGDDGWLKGSAYIMVSRSHDGGRTFEEPRIAAIIKNELSFFSGKFGFRWWSSMFPVIKVGPDGTLFITYSSDPDGYGPDGSDIFLVRSLDDGITWTKPVRVNDDRTKRDQFFPWIDVGPDGKVHIIWGDKRNDPFNYGYDVFYAYWNEENDTISKNFRVTDFLSNPTMGIPTFIGDYFNVVATEDNVHVVWTDSRRGVARLSALVLLVGNQDVYYARIGPRSSPLLKVLPNSIPAGAGAVVKLRAKNLSPEAHYLITFEGMVSQLTPLFLIADKYGNAEAMISLPSVLPGRYNISVSDFTTLTPIATSKVRVIDTAPLSVRVTGGTLFLRGDVAVFRIETSFKGSIVEANLTNIKLYGPERDQPPMDILVERIDKGIYQVSFSIDESVEFGSYTLVVEAEYKKPLISSRGLGTITFSVNPSLSALTDTLNSIASQVKDLTLTVESLSRSLEDVNKNVDRSLKELELLGLTLKEGFKDVSTSLSTSLTYISMILVGILALVTITLFKERLRKMGVR